MSEILLQSELPGLPEPRRGKVRDVYDLGDELLIVTTDRISAFDVILGEGIPDKGRVLNGLSQFWFNQFGDRVRHHALDSSWDALPDEVRKAGDAYRGRCLRAKKAETLPAEWIIRGFIAGSLWDAYEKGKPIAWEIDLPTGLTAGQELSEPIFTPSTKAETGHDEPLSYAGLDELVGKETADQVRDHCLTLFGEVSREARARGVILVDTKLEWGTIDGELILIDECFTPDSSRFVLAETYRPGGALLPYDKQLVRDFLLASSWDKKSRPPVLPPEIIEETRHRYLTIYKRITGGEPEGMTA